MVVDKNTAISDIEVNSTTEHRLETDVTVITLELPPIQCNKKISKRANKLL